MAAYAEIVNSKGAFRSKTLKVISNARPSFTAQCFKPDKFPDLDPEDVVHQVQCGDTVKNPRGGTIYCENDYPCLEYITCPYRDYSTSNNYHPPVQNPRHDQVYYLQWFHDHLGRKCLSFLPERRLAPSGHKTILRMGDDGPWCYFEKTKAFAEMLEDDFQARIVATQQAADKRAADKAAADAKKAESKAQETTDEPVWPPAPEEENPEPSDADEEASEEETEAESEEESEEEASEEDSEEEASEADKEADTAGFSSIPDSKPKAQRRIVLDDSDAEDEPGNTRKRTPAKPASDPVPDSKKQKVAQGPITPNKTAATQPAYAPYEMPTSMATYAANLQKQKAVGVAVLAVQDALDADPYGNALYYELRQLKHDRDSDLYQIKKGDFFKAPAGMAYRALSAEEMYKDVVKALKLKPLH